MRYPKAMNTLKGINTLKGMKERIDEAIFKRMIINIKIASLRFYAL